MFLHSSYKESYAAEHTCTNNVIYTYTMHTLLATSVFRANCVCN